MTANTWLRALLYLISEEIQAVRQSVLSAEYEVQCALEKIQEERQNYQNILSAYNGISDESIIIVIKNLINSINKVSTDSEVSDFSQVENTHEVSTLTKQYSQQPKSPSCSLLVAASQG